MKTIFYLCAFLSCVQYTYAQRGPNSKDRIIISVKTDPAPHYVKGAVGLYIIPSGSNGFQYPSPRDQSLQQFLKDGSAKFEVSVDEAKYVSCSVYPYSSSFWLVEPGDNIQINCRGMVITYTGKGSEKFILMDTITRLDYDLKKTKEYKALSDPKRGSTSSLADYLAWNSFLNKKSKLVLALIEAHKQKLTDFAYIRIKANALKSIEKVRVNRFNGLRRSTVLSPLNQYGLSNEDLCEIMDSTLYNANSKWLRFGLDYLYDPDYSYTMLHNEDYRERGKFFKTSPSDTAILGQDPSDQYVYIYNRAKQLYKGIVRENHLSYTLYDYDGAMQKVGFTPKVEALLNDYYLQPGFPEAKKIVRDFEMKFKAKAQKKGSPIFSLASSKGNTFTNQQLKGKIAVFDFWFTGCVGCVQMAPALRKVEEQFKNDTNVVFLSISTDKNKAQWLKSIQEGKYTSGGGIQLYTEGKGKDHEMIKKFFVDSYPTLEIIGLDGLFIKYEKQKLDPRYDNGKAMIALLKKLRAELKDGPYVFYDNKQVTSYVVDGTTMNKETLAKETGRIKVSTDLNATFDVQLKSSLVTERSECHRPEKLFALSDIEGNFDAFRKLLQQNKIIDENYNWIFGQGHLVFSGDMFDRGRQVTECLWLAYSLEEKAKAMGGYVHFVLGNHEIMNLQGDIRYVDGKYKDNAVLLGKTLVQLYSEDSELGRWLRTKNIVEKVGDILFMHGGISRTLNNLPVNISSINELARPNYALSKNDYGEEKINVIMSQSTGPFWYRQYYDDKKGMVDIIDSTLQKFDVKHIVTGHTIVADTISVHYGGKVINTDTKHAEGKSEALLIEGDKFYRVNTEGKKVLLFTDDKRKASGK